MAALGDIYRIQNEFVLVGDERAVVTQYYRVTTAGSGGASNVVSAWGTKFTSSILGLLNEDNTLLARSTINGMNNSDFLESVPNSNGSRTGASLPPGLTPVFRSERSQPGDRYSWQRWPFGSVSDLSDGGLWTSPMGTALAAFTDLLDDTLAPGTGEILEPCQITGGFILGTSPTFVRSLTGQWAFGIQPHWLESRQPDYTYTST